MQIRPAHAIEVSVSIESTDLTITESRYSIGPPSVEDLIAPSFDENGFSTGDIWKSVSYGDTPTFGDYDSVTGVALESSASDLIRNGFNARARAIRSVNKSVSLVNTAVASRCGACLPVTGTVSLFTSVVEGTYSATTAAGYFKGTIGTAISAVPGGGHAASQIGTAVDLGVSFGSNGQDKYKY